MMEAIRTFFDKYISGPQVRPEKTGHDPLHIATTALLVEMMRMSGEVAESERARVLHAVETKFGLRAEDTATLLQLAEAEAREATDYYQFTSLIKNRLNPEEKQRLIEHLWAVAYADGELHQYEDHLVRKIADLLYVPHRALMAAKLRARGAADDY
jgi:uncharacterized tellurite resistance protein B-like protein